MIKPVHAEVRIAGIEMVLHYDDPGKLENHAHRTIVRRITNFLIKENMISMKRETDYSMDEHIFTGILYVATEDDYKYQERGPGASYSEQSVKRLQQESYERGVRWALTSVADRANKLSKDRLKKNQHAAMILIETATEVEEELV